ncbi:MAG: non-specific DNA-binding protein DpsA [Parvularculaceae bacterium]
MDIDIGIDADDRMKVAGELKRVLADTYTLYLKTHNYHWNVTGPMFQTLHVLFEEQYNEMWIAVDELAERIRALGASAPGSYRQFAELTTVEDAEADVPDAETMIRNLVRGHEAVVKSARAALDVADDADDAATEDLLTQRIQIHEKTAWMLRSLLG